MTVVDEYTPVSWLEVDPDLFEQEQRQMAEVAPGMTWNPEARAWVGELPEWPFEREPPGRLPAYLAGRRAIACICYSEAHPAAPPRVLVLEPEVDPRVRTLHDWHVNGDGALCLFQNASDWLLTAGAADLAIKAASWFLEFCLMEDGRVDCMTADGIVSDPSRDHLFTFRTASDAK